MIGRNHLLFCVEAVLKENVIKSLYLTRESTKIRLQRVEQLIIGVNISGDLIF